MASVDRVVVNGFGYVGLPLTLAFVRSGYDVIGVALDDERVEHLRNGESYAEDIEDRQVAEAVDQVFNPNTGYKTIKGADGVSICVHMPLRKSGQPDVCYVVDAVNLLAEVVSPETGVVLGSTVYPGATEEILDDRLASNGWSVGEDLFVAFSPERIDPGNESYGVTNIPKVTIQDRTYESQPFSTELLERQDCVVIVPDHAAIDLEVTVQHAPRVFDPRNATAGLGQPEHVQLP